MMGRFYTKLPRFYRGCKIENPQTAVGSLRVLRILRIFSGGVYVGVRSRRRDLPLEKTRKTRKTRKTGLPSCGYDFTPRGMWCKTGRKTRGGYGE